MCLYPRLINNKKYRATKKNGGIIPPIKDQRTNKVPIGCGTCIECRKMKAREWQARLQQDLKTNANAKFITLTYSTESLQKILQDDRQSHQKLITKITKLEHLQNTQTGWEYLQTTRKIQTLTKRIKKPLDELKGYQLDNELATRTIRLFLERWRKETGKSLRHWLVTELGHEGTEHIHLHGIVWTQDLELLEKTWKYGFVWKGKPIRKRKNTIELENYVTCKTVNYICKYVTKLDEKHLAYKPIILCSAGIGNNYITRGDHRNNIFNGRKTTEYFRTNTGHKIALPIYWRNKIYTEEQREQLWLYKLDKLERWICGEKICIKKNYDSYDNCLQYHRARTIKLGYPPPEFIWKKQEYENQRRTLIQAKRYSIAPRNTTEQIDDHCRIIQTRVNN